MIVRDVFPDVLHSVEEVGISFTWRAPGGFEGYVVTEPAHEAGRISICQMIAVVLNPLACLVDGKCGRTVSGNTEFAPKWVGGSFWRDWRVVGSGYHEGREMFISRRMG